MFVISSERSDERSLLLVVVGMTVSSVSFLPLSHFVTAPLEKWSSPVAQAKRSDGGVLKVEQPGGPLAVEEFDRIKRIEKHKFLQRRCRWRNLCQLSMVIIVLPILCYFTRTLASRNCLALGNA